MSYRSDHASPPTATEMTAEGAGFLIILNNTGMLSVHNSLMETKDSSAQTIPTTEKSVQKGSYW